MCWPRSHPKRLELAPSRYPARLKWLSLLLVSPAVLLMTAPWWAKAVTLLAVVALLRHWRLPVARQLEWREKTLLVTGKRVQTLAPPYRVLRVGPWLALATPRGWLHLFQDQAPPERLQPFYQWLWVNKGNG